jgi:hypothetical protein
MTCCPLEFFFCLFLNQILILFLANQGTLDHLQKLNKENEQCWEIEGRYLFYFLAC